MKTLLVGLFASFVFFELVLRGLSLYSYQIKFYTNNPHQRRFLDDVVDWRGLAASTLCPMPPGGVLNGFIINSRGNISPEMPYDKQPGTKRLVLVGDSHAVGAVPYPDHFIRVLERRVNETSEYQLDVINLGLNCIGPLIEEKILALEGARYDPDVVVLAFFVGNDFTDDRIYNDKFVKAKKNERHIMPPLFYQSQLLSFFRNYIVFHMSPHNAPTLQAASEGKPGTYIGFPGFDAQRPSFSEEEYLGIEQERSQIFFHNSEAYEDVETIQQNIRSMKSVSEKSNARFVVLIIPDEMQVNESLLQKVASLSGRRITDYNIYYPQQLLTRFLDENAIDYVDLFSFWKDSSKSAGFYLNQDSHLNVSGNMAVADILHPRIQLLLDQ